MKKPIFILALVIGSSAYSVFAQAGPINQYRLEKVTLYFPDGKTDTRLYTPDNATKGMRWYINNGGCIIMEDPESAEIFCGTYKIFRQKG